MKYEVEFKERVIDLLIEWKPPDLALDELERFVDEALSADPVRHLKKVSPTGTMQCNCHVLDRDAGCVHIFLIRVYYGKGEKSLIVYDAFYYTFQR